MILLLADDTFVQLKSECFLFLFFTLSADEILIKIKVNNELIEE
jgi:hypothetical protein